eukprot:TRINITY_DN64465_c0_g1_i1.p1 TRINITY_DN64465_c0_g1~~TRINITY_DN64465_c0_g1_i1.p1  ORF type:complete len:410 (-),score=68.38 TRINITY_DN64465_c0_g1_i1:239-1321(-)
MRDRDLHDQHDVRLASRRDDEDGPLDAEQRQLCVEVARLGRQRQWQEALARLASVPEAGQKLRTAALSACARSLQLEQGRRIFDEMPVKTVPACNAFIMLLGRLKRVRDVEQVLSLMRAQQLQPSGVTYGCLMTSYGMVRDMSGVMRAFEEMRAASIVPTTVTFGSVLGACARAGDTAQAMLLLQEMERLSLDIGPGHMTSTIVSCAPDKNEAKAREVFQDMRRRGLKPNVVAYTALMSCIPPTADAMGKADALLAEMKSEGVVPDAYTYNELMNLAISVRDVVRCHALLSEMAAAGVAPTRETDLRKQQLQRLEQEMTLAVVLPPGWREAKDPSSGNSYFWHESDPSGTTTWDHPGSRL